MGRVEIIMNFNEVVKYQGCQISRLKIFFFQIKSDKQRQFWAELHQTHLELSKVTVLEVSKLGIFAKKIKFKKRKLCNFDNIYYWHLVGVR